VIVEVYREETYDDDANEDTATDNAESNSSTSTGSSQSEEQNSPNSVSNEDSENFDAEMYSVEDTSGAMVARARAKREIRHTKTYEFKESDGATQGMVVFQLDKQSPQEAFRLEHANKWVSVDPSGAVKVK